MTRRWSLVIAVVLCPLTPCHGQAPLAHADHAENARSAARYHWRDGALSRVTGSELATGPSPAASGAAFVADSATRLGVASDTIVPASRTAVPLGYDPATGTHRFTVFHYEQKLGDLSVFGARLTTLVRHVAGNPVVHASCDLRGLDGFTGDAASVDLDALRPLLRRHAGPGATLQDEQIVIWAGRHGRPASPRLAVRFTAIETDAPRPRHLLCVADAATGELLHREDRICDGTITGSVAGVGSAELGSDWCTDAFTWTLPYARVTAGTASAWADADGQYTLDTGAESPAVVQSAIRGQYFKVANLGGVDALLTFPVAGGVVDFLHNAADAWEFERSQVNAYVHANIIRDWVMSVNPAYPGIADMSEFELRVNQSSDCNAFFNPGGPSLNFFTSGAGCPNTAFDTIVYHEFGHYLVDRGGSDQIEYGEGLSDALAALATDQPVVGQGWYGPCDGWLRRTDNDCFYSPSTCTTNCGSLQHGCGRLFAASVWALRDALLLTEPDDYRQIVASLMLDSILLHTGSGIDPSITLDFLTLDDDDADLSNGTPHYNEIATAFGAHGLPAPALSLFEYEFPQGTPDVVDPVGGAMFRVELTAVNATPGAGTGTLHVSLDGREGPYTAVPMTPLSATAYDAVLPPTACGETVHYYVSVASDTGVVQPWPAGGPLDALTAVGATLVAEAIADDFETDLGWTVTDDAALTDGAWARGVPAGDGDRGDPIADADGSGQCYLTGNSAGNSDVDGGVTTLTSPLVAVPAGAPAVLSYSRWYSNTGGANPGQDVFTVEVSADGQTWVLAETVGPEGVGTDGGWFSRQVQLNELLPGAAAVAVRFIAGDADLPSVIEAGVDGVTVTAFACATACPADVDGDGDVNVDDLVAVITAWGTADSAADVTADGAVDVDDLVAVVVAWGDCP